MTETFTHIVAGGGTAGCVLAARLSEEPANRVLLLEAGGRDWNPMFHIPLGTGKLLRSGLYGWRYCSEPMQGAANRKLFWPRAKVLGGCSSINGMVYIRGAAEEYDAWAEAGANGWSWTGVLPYFLRAEGHESRGLPHHGIDGPLRVERAKSSNPLYPAFLGAAAEAGFPVVDDFNTGAPEGFGRWDFTIHNGRRQSAAVAYLRPALARPNLRVITGAHVTRVVLEGSRAVGVAYTVGGRVHVAHAEAEVTLTAGAIGSPHLLMLSGIGPADQLRAAGIVPVIDLPGVGANLQDHAVAGVGFACPEPITLHTLIRADRAAAAMLQAWLWRSGPAARFPVEAGAFTRSHESAVFPDLQWYFNLGLDVSRLRFPLLRRSGAMDQDGFTIQVCLLRPHSRGRIELRSANPMTAPRLFANYLDDPRDLETLRRGVEQIRHIANQPSLRPYITTELSPGAAVQGEAVADYIRRTVANAHHQSGTCRIGNDDLAVVDPDLRVRGISGLRVADAAVMPLIPSGGTYAPTVMVAEKAADLIRGRTPLPAVPDATAGALEPAL